MEESYIDSRISGLLDDEITRINNHFKPQNMITINGEPHLQLKDYEPLKEAYNRAKTNGQESFQYEGETFDVGFAFFLLQFLEMKMNYKTMNNE